MVTHVVHEMFEGGVNKGLKKLSELSGSKAKQVEAAREVADKFLSALKDDSPEEAKAYCDASIFITLGDKILEDVFSGRDLSLMTWSFTSMDDSSESNKWGRLYDLNLTGDITHTKIGNDPESIAGEFNLRMLKKDEGWKVLGWDLLT